MNLGPAINSVANEAVPSISHDGLLLFFSGAAYGPFRADGCGEADLWFSTRASASDPWSTRMNLGQYVNSPESDLGPNISADSSTLYFASKRDGGVGHYDLWQVAINSIYRSFQKDNATSTRITVENDDGKEG